MKTFEDFNLDIFRKEIVKLGEKEGGLSEEKVEKLLFSFLNKAKDKLETKVACLTCGVGYRLNNLEHDCQDEDIWLNKYVKNSVLNKNLKSEFAERLQSKYPYDKKGYFAFRGINFKTKEQYDAFIEQSKTGHMTFETISSWSLSFEYAKKFACWTQQGTREADHMRKEEIMNMVKDKSNITGYKGLVLAFRPTPEMVLCDISSQNIGNMSEKEIILLPGTYKVEIARTIEKEVGNKIWSEKELKEAKL